MLHVGREKEEVGYLSETQLAVHAAAALQAYQATHLKILVPPQGRNLISLAVHVHTTAGRLLHICLVLEYLSWVAWVIR